MASYISGKQIFRMILIFCFLNFYASCSNEDAAIDCVPRSYVNFPVNLNLTEFIKLNNLYEFVQLEPSGTNGSRGMILFNSGMGGIRAYDRNAPHICPTANSTLMVKDGLIVECPEDGAQWLLTTGQPHNKETKGRPLRQFYVERIGNELLITN